MAYRGSFSFGSGLTPWVQRLLIANVVVFMLDTMNPVIGYYLAFEPAAVLLRPWTMFTYMFVHQGFMHMFWNMLGLFFFGPPLEGRWGSKEFIKYYVIAGLGGAALSFVFAPSSSIVGASAAVYGVMLAFAMNWPDAPIYIWGILPVKAKYLVGVLGAVSFMSMLQPGRSDNIAHAAHLGGFVAGFLYLKFSGPGGPFSNFTRMMNRRKLKVVSDAERPRPQPVGRTSSTPPAARRRGAGEDEKLLDQLDRVLEKISTQGMHSLTPEERRLLDEVSQKYRTD
jgi:membrane associated rhomboid family serine protease